ncbi:MAG: hypothetical protein CL607_22600 [Anaerolineaceae bacterium]|nr:hypothetical protein [Anaerolineaceae bacterium]
MGQLNDLWLFVLLDLSVLFLCIMMLARTKELTFFHSAVLFLSLHVLVFTLRMISISLGAPTLFNENYLIRLGFEPVRYDEIIRAIVYADIGLFVSTIGFIVAGIVHKRRVVESIAEWIKDGENRLLCDASDESSLANAIIAGIQHPEMWEHGANLNRQLAAERADIRVTIPQAETFYETILAQHRDRVVR